MKMLIKKKQNRYLMIFILFNNLNKFNFYFDFIYFKEYLN